MQNIPNNRNFEGPWNNIALFYNFHGKLAANHLHKTNKFVQEASDFCTTINYHKIQLFKFLLSK